MSFTLHARGWFALVALTALWGAPLSAQAPRLGSIDFPNSGAAEAQADFVLGALLLHSFEYQPAAEAFRRAQAADPDFALAYWGEAMTYNHPLWQEQDRGAAREVLARFEGEAKTEREGMYLSAVAALYGEGSKAERDAAYSDAMRRLHERFPEDDEARAFYALSVLGLTDGVRDFRNYMRAAALAQPVFERNPDHPGAAHYLIHSFDDPIHAPLGLPAARAYGPIAPDAGHAQHMTSHIFLAMGMWDDVIRANINATRVQDRGRVAAGGTPNHCGHYSSWLAYGYLMKERWDEAAAIMDRCHLAQETPDRDDRDYYVGMRARQVFDSRDWSLADRWSYDLSDTPGARRASDFVNAYAALQRGDRSTGERLFETLREGGGDDSRSRIRLLELEALLARARGDGGRAVALLREAARLEEGLPFEFGPPASLKPPHELLGEVLLEMGRGVEAVEAFQGSLAITPLRTPSLRGLARAADMAGLRELAQETERRIEEITR